MNSKELTVTPSIAKQMVRIFLDLDFPVNVRIGSKDNEDNVPVNIEYETEYAYIADSLPRMAEVAVKEMSKNKKCLFDDDL